MWFTEAGKGGSGPCVGSATGGVQCFGLSGRVSRVRQGQREIRSIISNVGSLGTPLLDQATGPNGIAFRDGEPFVLIGNPGTEAVTRQLGPLQKDAGILVSLRREEPDQENQGKSVWFPETLADLSNFEFVYRPDNLFNPDGTPRAESNPFGLTSAGDELYATDAAGHTVLQVSRTGNLSVVAVLPSQSIDKPAFPGGPTPVNVDSVPTAIIPAPDGNGLLVADYTGYPFFPGSSRIWRVSQAHAPQPFATGFTNLIGLSPARDGGVYALEMTRNGYLSSDPAGDVIYISPSGQRKTIACHGLIYPTGIATGPNGNVYVSNYGVIPGYGEVVRISTLTPSESSCQE